MDASPTLRPRAELQRVHERMTRVQAAERAADEPDPTAPMTEATLAALEWVLGRRSASPLLGRTEVAATDPEEIERERRAATRMLEREEDMDPRGHSYVSGVEDTLMWVRGLSVSRL